MNIYVSMNTNVRKMFFNKETYDSLSIIGNVLYNENEYDLNADEMSERLSECDIVVTGWGQTKITPEIAGKRLKMVVHTGGSVGPIICEGLYDMGIKVVSGNELYARSVAEGVMAYILCELRKLNTYSSTLKKGRWTSSGQLETCSLKGKTIGIISFGKISSYLLTLLKPFDVDIKVYSTRPDEEKSIKYGFTYASMEEIFSNCDIVTVHTAANPSTYHMINDKLFALLKPGSIFINTSRGSVIDEQALINRLEQGRFSAVLDVYEKEPLNSQSGLLEFDNVTLYPHMAGPAADLRTFITSEVIEDARHFINSEDLLYEINKETYMGMTQTR